MSAILYIHAKTTNNSECELEVDLETLLVLKVYDLCELGNVNLEIIQKNDLVEPVFRTKCRFSKHCNEDGLASYVKLPALIRDIQGSKSIVAGICSVARKLIKFNADESKQYLLGFRESCLAACSESSIWTKFCEVDMINTVRNVLKQNRENKLLNNKEKQCNHSNNQCGNHGNCKQNSNNSMQQLFCNHGNIGKQCEKKQLGNHSNSNVIEKQLNINENSSKCNEVILPDDLLRFEYHLQQPVRMHNVYKVARETRNDKSLKSSVPLAELNIPHCYSEGPCMTLSDVILLPSFMILLRVYNENVFHFKEYLPLTHQWIERMRTFEAFKTLVDFIELTEISSKVAALECVDVVINSNVKQESLYSSDPNRYKPTHRIYTKQDEVEKALDIVHSAIIIKENVIKPYGFEVGFNWDDIPMILRPEGGALPKKRSKRKEEQLESLAKAVVKITLENEFPGVVKIVDFCSGSGHLGLLLAYLLPKCTVFLVENKEKSLERALVRIKALNLSNVIAIQSNLDYFQGAFDIGVSLHACGVATDLVMQHCIWNQAHFVCCPCCYGGIHDCDHLKFPRSVEFTNGVAVGEYMKIAHAADQTHDKQNAKTEQGYHCMDIIDTDRCLYAEHCGYEVFLGKLMPETCTPKNNLLVGLCRV